MIVMAVNALVQLCYSNKKIENVYARGQRASITTIIRQIRLDKRQGVHAELSLPHKKKKKKTPQKNHL